MNSTPVISVLVIIWMLGSSECNANKTVLVVGQLDERSSANTCKAIKLAYEVAKNSSALKTFFEKYEIQIECVATQINPGNAIVNAVDLLLRKKGAKPIVILGPHTPEQATVVLHVMRYFRKLMVTYLTTTAHVDELLDRYAFTFKLTAYAFNPAKVKIMKHFGWKRAAIVYDFLQKGGFYVKVVENLAKEAQGNFDVIAFEAVNTKTNLITGDVFEIIRKNLEKLKALDTKIFIGEFNTVGASLIFCEVYKLKMYGPEYVWILNPDAGTVDDWVALAEKEKRQNKTSDICTREQYQYAVNRSFLLGESFRTDVNITSASGLSQSQLFNKLGLKSPDMTEKRKTAAAFDAMWTVMLAMNEASKALPTTYESNSGPLELNSAVLGTDSVTIQLSEEIKNVSFEGLTGPVSFTQDKNGEGLIELKQYQDRGAKLVSVGYYIAKGKGDRLEFYNGSEKSLWKERTPLDRTLRILQPTDIHPSLFIIFSTIASFGIVLGVVFLVFNRYYRGYKFIRLSAPMFNDVMVLGCILCLSTVYLFGLRDLEKPTETMPRICKARAWILTIGFSLAFGAMFIKTWRIYKICTNKRLSVRLGPLSDWWMLAMVGGIVLIDVATLVAWEVTDPLQHKAVNLTYGSFLEDAADPYKVVILTLNTCTAENLPIWLALIYVYKGILLLYGLFLAYETRNVVYAHLNDSRVIGICVYNVVVLSMIGAFLALILNDEQYQQLYAALSVCIALPATGTISMIFIPKLIHRIKTNSLDDETGESTLNHTFTRPSIDISNTYQGTTMGGGERFVDATSPNTLCVYQNGGFSGSLSAITSQPQPETIQELSPKALED